MTDFLLVLDATKAAKTALRHTYDLAQFGRFLAARGILQPTVGVLSRDLLEGFYVWLGDPATSRHGKGRTLDTRAKIVEAVENLWDWLADAERYQDHTPRPKRLKDLPADVGVHKVAPTWSEMDAAAMSAPGWYAWLFVCLRFLGLRKEQTMALRIADFRLERAQLVFRGELGKTKQERRGRVIPVSRHFVDLVRMLLKLGYLDVDGPLVPTAGEKRIPRPETSRLAWEAAGVRPEAWQGAHKDRPHHAFRSGFESGLKAAGGDLTAIDFLVGHDLPGVQADYVDPEALNLRAAVDLVPPVDAVLAAKLITLAAARRAG